jgi:hypothetical protein
LPWRINDERILIEPDLRRFTVDDVVSDLGRLPDVIRMDVQGLELEVLAGARRTLEAARGRITIVAEMHRDEWADHGIALEEVAALLASLRLKARSLDPSQSLFDHDSLVVFEPD